jgi:methionine-rich copper-binding protein CopC
MILKIHVGLTSRTAKMPHSSTHRLSVLAVLALLVLTAPPWAIAALERPTDDRHLTLRATIPEADSTVTEPPPEVRLIFSEPPQMQGTSIRLVDEDEELVPTTAPAADEEDPREVFIRPDEPLMDGTYTVMWRTIAQDGHAQNGSFEFSVQIGR